VTRIGDEMVPGTPGGPPEEQLLTVVVVERDDALILRVTGEVDGLTVARLRTAVADAFAELEARMLVVDLTAVRFLGSPGLRALLDTAAHAATMPGYRTLRVVVDRNRPVIRPLEVTGMDKVLALYHEVTDALAG